MACKCMSGPVIISDLEKLSHPVRSRIAVALQTSINEFYISDSVYDHDEYVADFGGSIRVMVVAIARSKQDT